MRFPRLVLLTLLSLVVAGCSAPQEDSDAREEEPTLASSGNVSFDEGGNVTVQSDDGEVRVDEDRAQASSANGTATASANATEPSSEERPPWNESAQDWGASWGNWSENMSRDRSWENLTNMSRNDTAPGGRNESVAVGGSLPTATCAPGFGCTYAAASNDDCCPKVANGSVSGGRLVIAWDSDAEALTARLLIASCPEGAFFCPGGGPRSTGVQATGANPLVLDVSNVQVLPSEELILEVSPGCEPPCLSPETSFTVSGWLVRVDA